MIIEYEKNKYVTEIKQLEITDSKNVFLKGKNMYDNLPTYFGIWENNGGLSIVTIIRYCIISYKYYLSTNLSTVCDIQEYLRNSNNVEIINKDEFKEQINYIKSIFKIWKDDFMDRLDYQEVKKHINILNVAYLKYIE